MLKKWIYLAGLVGYLALLSHALQQVFAAGVSAHVGMVLYAGWALALLGGALFDGWLLLRSDQVFATLEKIFTWISNWHAWLRAALFLMLVLLPAPLVYTQISRGLMGNLWFRIAIFIPLLLLAQVFIPFTRPGSFWGRFSLALLAAVYFVMSADQLAYVQTYPFSIGWSEGNRFYDYSLSFGNNLYQYSGHLEIPYFSPGRYGLWGIWFLIPGLPIVFHRFWNAVLWFVPPLVLGWVIARSVPSRGIRLAIALWVTLFLVQGPIYAPLLLSALLVLGLSRSPKWLYWPAIAFASLYAGLSRWTWFAAPGAWAVLIYICDQDTAQRQSWVRRLFPATGLALIGSLPGLLVNWTRLIAPQGKTLSLSQPLLFYRLFPNATYRPGLLLGIAIAALPLAILLLWLILTRRWKLDWLAQLAIAGACLGFLGAGLVASTKIGGGSNLHNLDMFLVTLVVLLMLYLDQQGLSLSGWPAWISGVMALAIFIPVWAIISVGGPVVMPSGAAVQEALDKINSNLDLAESKGEILFMDQRQLLTFDTVKPVPLVPDYEKKYVMDQAMAGNSVYFTEFYKDLAAHRFSLIVSEPLFTRIQDESYSFNEENNAWVKWVSEPLLCFYQVKTNLREVGIQLLIPRTEPDGDCASKYK